MGFIRVLLVEEDFKWREGLSKFLEDEPDIMIAGTAETIDETVEIAQTRQVDVALVDLMLGEDKKGGIEATKQLCSLGVKRVIVTVSPGGDKETICDAIAAGAVEIFSKSDFSYFAELPALIRRIHRFDSWLPSSIVDILREGFLQLANQIQVYEVERYKTLLTECEIEIIKLISEGYTQSQVANQLSVAEKTVKNHVTHIHKKLGTKKSVEAVEKLQKLGVISIRN